MFLAAFASLRDPESKTFYDRKRAEGKKHNAALICLARRRCDVILAMLRDHEPYLTPAERPPRRTPVAAEPLDKNMGTPPSGSSPPATRCEAARSAPGTAERRGVAWTRASTYDPHHWPADGAPGRHDPSDTPGCLTHRARTTHARPVRVVGILPSARLGGLHQCSGSLSGAGPLPFRLVSITK